MPDRALRANAGLAAVTELCGLLGVIRPLDAAVGPVKQRDRGFGAGELLTGIAAARGVRPGGGDRADAVAAAGGAGGSDALCSYLRSLKDAVAQYEAKILVVGEGNVGKTSLLAALRDEPFVAERPTTHGIEIQALTLHHPDLDLNMTVRAWDFGGQEVYRITHQFFFSRRALYLLVWCAREGQEQNEVDGWLRRIRLRVGHEARTLIVTTHCDERHPELDYPYLARSYPGMLAGRYEIDNLSGNGIAELRTGIAGEAGRLPHMGQLISPRWIAARDDILSRAKAEPQIRYAQFEELCQSHGVVGDEIGTLAELLHDSGQIIYYGGDEGLRDIVVLNPEWLTKAISYVLEDEPTRQSGGVLDHTCLAKIWQDRDDGFSYPERYHPYFLRLMEKFDVSYRLEDNEQSSLVAQLVPHERPDLEWDSHAALAEGKRSLALTCRLTEPAPLPAPGLIAWLTVRHHGASTGKHWRNGVFLRHPNAMYASEALLELTNPRELAIEVRAPSPDLFLHVLQDTVEDLIRKRWPGLNGVKLSGDRHPPEDDRGQGCQAGCLAWFAGLVPASWALGLAFVAAAWPVRDEVAVPGDLGGQVRGELVKERRGKSIRSR